MQRGGEAKALTSEGTRLYLQEVDKARNESNRGIPRKEMIQLISEIQSCPIKTASNHYEWLVQTKKLPELKRGGRVVAAQPTTTNGTAITTQKIMRTHVTMDSGKFNYVLLLHPYP